MTGYSFQQQAASSSSSSQAPNHGPRAGLSRDSTTVRENRNLNAEFGLSMTGKKKKSHPVSHRDGHLEGPDTNRNNTSLSNTRGMAISMAVVRRTWVDIPANVALKKKCCLVAIRSTLLSSRACSQPVCTGQSMQSPARTGIKTFPCPFARWSE
jgi:hypothetical protein